MADWGLWNNDIEFISSEHAPAFSYIHQPRPTAALTVEENRQVVRYGGELQAAIRHLLHISPTLLFTSLFQHLAIILSPHILFPFFCCGILRCIHLCFLHLSILPSPPTKPCLPPCLSFSPEVSTISLTTAGWGVLSSQVQGDGRLGRLAPTHSVFTLRYLLPVNTKLHWTRGV